MDSGAGRKTEGARPLKILSTVLSQSHPLRSTSISAELVVVQHRKPTTLLLTRSPAVRNWHRAGLDSQDKSIPFPNTFSSLCFPMRYRAPIRTIPLNDERHDSAKRSVWAFVIPMVLFRGLGDEFPSLSPITT